MGTAYVRVDAMVDGAVDLSVSDGAGLPSPVRGSLSVVAELTTGTG